jgi:cysteine desulfurase family protein
LRETYLDNAATSWPKPPGVVEAIERFSVRCGASAGRGAYPRADAAGEILERCRARAARMIGAADPARVVFALNCTDAIHLALRGIEWRSGDVAIVGPTEHNSVMRPLHAIRDRFGIEIDRLPARPCGRAEIDALETALRRHAGRVRIFCLQHASNVLGAIQPVDEAARLCRAAGAPLLVDAAQTAGAIPIDVDAAGIDLLAAPGHKALLGPLGTGLLYARPGLDLLTVREGGTGSRSEEETQPAEWPDRMEAGSQNLVGIAGLDAALAWIDRRGLEAVRAHEVALTKRLIDGLDGLRGLRALGPPNAPTRVPLVAFALEGRPSEAVAEDLHRRAGICARPGLHCAPAAHRHAGTYPDGAVRLSVGPFTTTAEVDRAVEAVRRVAAGRS